MKADPFVFAGNFTLKSSIYSFYVTAQSKAKHLLRCLVMLRAPYENKILYSSQKDKRYYGKLQLNIEAKPYLPLYVTAILTFVTIAIIMAFIGTAIYIYFKK